MSKVFGVFFEANAIQQYILSGGRLRDIVGASYLIDSLGEEVLNAVCKQLGLRQTPNLAPDSVRFPRRAAGAIYALFSTEQQAVDFAALWSLVVRSHCPSLSFSQVMVDGDSDFAVLQLGTTRLAHVRVYPAPDLPPATPITERAPRTGRAKAGETRIGTDKNLEAVDAALASRRSVTPQAIEAMDDRLLSAEAKLAHHPELKLKNVFPRNLEFKDVEDDLDATQRWQFPFRRDSRYLAIVHADGNGFGQILLNVIAAAGKMAANSAITTSPPPGNDAYSEFLPKLSATVATCTRHAVQHATQAVLLPHGEKAVARGEAFWRLPARPIVIAGDDLTMIVRADLALSFTSHFICAFERLTQFEFENLRSAFPDLGQHLPSTGLTACAGIAYARNNQPFAMLHEVAEELCGQAKQQVKELARGKPFAGSAIACRRITESLSSDEISTELLGTPVLPRLGALAVGNTNHGLPTVQLLDALLATLLPGETEAGNPSGTNEDPLGKGPLRRILNTVFMQPLDASVDYKRWTSLASLQPGKNQIAPFSKALGALAHAAGGYPWDELPAIAWPVDPGTGPSDRPRLARLVLQELVDLLAVGHRPMSAPQETVDE